MALTPELDSPLYVEMIRLIERAHRRFLEVVKDELDRIGRDDINNVQAVLLYNIGQEELTPSELKGRGYYLGSNVSYNLKKLLELGFIEQKKSRADRRTILISLTPSGAEIADMVGALFERQLKSLKPIGGVDDEDLRACNRVLMRIDRFWQDQVLYRL
jgi:DNA-binding MarR family transcriptional regulator